MASPRPVDGHDEDGGGTGGTSGTGEAGQLGNNPNLHRLNNHQEGVVNNNITDNNGDLGDDEREQQHNLSSDVDDDENICVITQMHTDNPVQLGDHPAKFDLDALLQWLDTSFSLYPDRARTLHRQVTHPLTRVAIRRSEIQNHISPMTDELRVRIQNLQDGWNAQLEQM